MFPASLLDELDAQELEQIGIHEAAHLFRGDDYALLLQRTLEAIFALHPVVRWISRRIDLEREIACDDFVIASTNNPQPYAACLARVVELTGGIRVTPIATSAADRSHLARRVDTLLDNTRHSGTRLLGIRLALATIGLAAMSWGVVQMPGLISFATTSCAHETSAAGHHASAAAHCSRKPTVRQFLPHRGQSRSPQRGNPPLRSLSQ